MSQDKDIQAARVAFEAVYPVPAQCVWAGNGYAATCYNAWDAQTHCHRWEGWLAARRELASSLLEHEGTASAAVLVLRADVDELVTPAAVRANEVDAEVINAGLDVVEGNLDAAADADPHGNSRMVDTDLHDSSPAPGIQGRPVAWRYRTPTGWHTTTDAGKAARLKCEYGYEVEGLAVLRACDGEAV